MDYRDEWNKIGYNLEELYFEKLNRELIRKMKAQSPVQQVQSNEQPMGVVLQFRARTVNETNTPEMKKAAQIKYGGDKQTLEDKGHLP